MTKKKVLVVYYTQSGQLKDIVDSVCTPLHKDFDFTFEELKPRPAFPFPWKELSFYQAFPESVQEIPCELEEFSFDPTENFDLIILAYQPWYLSASIPFTSFLQTKEAARVLNGKPVITILGCRNMWAMAHERVKRRIADHGGNLIGNIALVDRHHNLVSVVTIVRWMLKGQQHGKGLYGKLFPVAGVDKKEIAAAGKFGQLIGEAAKKNDYSGLQDRLIRAGAVKINPVLLTIEQRGFMMFKPWSKFILKKGNAGEAAREGRLKMFRAYLFTVIYLVSPLGGIIVWTYHKIAFRKTRKLINYYSHNELRN